MAKAAGDLLMRWECEPDKWEIGLVNCLIKIGKGRTNKKWDASANFRIRQSKKKKRNFQWKIKFLFYNWNRRMIWKN